MEAGNGFECGSRQCRKRSLVSLRPLATWFAALGLSALPWHAVEDGVPTTSLTAQARLAHALLARAATGPSPDMQPDWTRKGLPTVLPPGATAALAAPSTTEAAVPVQAKVKPAAEPVAAVARDAMASLFDPAALGSGPVRLGENLPLSAELKGPGAASAPVVEEVVAQAAPPAGMAEPVVTASLDPSQAVPVPSDRPSMLEIPEPQPRPFSLQAPSAPERPRLAQPVPTRRTREALAPTAPAEDRGFFEKLFGVQKQQGPALAYAVPQDDVIDASRGRRMNPTTTSASAGTAVYDIAAKVVYMPNGDKLEAHSGLGDRRDDPRFAHVSMKGVTPPHLYDLALREQLFHGVRALRLNPVGGAEAIHNRVGLLAHTFMLGPNGDSNGCVSFRDYDRFLQAYLRGDVKRLLVVASMN